MLRMPKPSLSAMLTLTALLLAGCSDAPEAPATQQNTAEAPAPMPVKLEADGRWLVLNYWAEWCKPCLEEIPELNAFASANADTVRVVMVNFDGISGEALRNQAADLGIKTELIDSDPGPDLGVNRPQALPTTYIFDPALQLTHTLLGPQKQENLGKLIAQ